jgi:hypothetical protein
MVSLSSIILNKWPDTQEYVVTTVILLGMQKKEISMLTPWVANRVPLTLQSISRYERMQFSGKRILFVGDMLQLPLLFRIVQCSLRIDS